MSLTTKKLCNQLLFKLFNTKIQFTEAKFIQIREVDTEFLFIKMKECMKASGLMIKGTAKAMKFLLMVTFIMVHTNLESHMVKVCTLGRMVRFMTENGIWELKTVTEFGGVLLETHI